MSERNIDHLLAEADNILSEGQQARDNSSFDMRRMEESYENIIQQGKSPLLDQNGGNTMIEQSSPKNSRHRGDNHDFQPMEDDNSGEINYLDMEQKKLQTDLELQKKDSSTLSILKMKTYNKFSSLIPQLLDTNNQPRKSNRRQIDGDLDSNSEDSDIMSQAVETQNDITFLNTHGQEVAMRTHPRLNNYRNLFKNLLKQNLIKLCDPVVSMLISKDSTRAISISKKDETTFCISQHDLESYEQTFYEQLGGEANDFIKCKEIVQNKDGNLFAVAYNNDGVFKIRIFGKENRDKEEQSKNDIDLNKILDLPNRTMCNVQDHDPFINIVFISENKLYVCLFQNLQKVHYHFFLSVNEQVVLGEVVKQEMKGSIKNYPSKSFFNNEQNEIYTIYRQSEAFIISADDARIYRFDSTIMEEPGVALGQMYLIFNKTLIVSCSSDILFFKIEHSVETDNREFQIYQSILNVGQNSIYFIENNERIQIVTADKIYFYKMNRETLEAELQYVMFNHMKCNQIMIGPQVKYAVTYKQNEQSFEIHRRRYIHGFKVPVITKQNYEGGICIDLPSVNCFVVALLDKISFFDSNTFHQRKELSLDIQLLKADTREPNQIISMAKSINDEFIAVITGKILVMSEQKMNQLYVFRKRKRDDEIKADSDSKASFDFEAVDFYYERISVIQLREVEQFREGGVCTDFHFFQEKNKDVDRLLFCRKDVIFLLNFKTKEMQKVFKFEKPMKLQPLQMEPNHDNMVIMVTSPSEGYLIDLRKPKNEQCLVFHKIFNINTILSVVYEVVERDFYIICNKYNENLGFFVLKISQDEPTKCTFLIKWKNKLNIGNCTMYILRNPERGYSELIIGFKQIYVNSYSLFCIDISIDDVEHILFRHDSYQLWETNCTGILLNNKSSDFVTLNQDGMWITSFGAKNLDQDGNNESQNRQRVIKDDCGQERMLHSIESCNFLKLEKENYIFLNCMNPDSQVISVCQEYQKVDSQLQGEDEMGQWVLYNVDLQHVNLRELLLFQSLSTSKSMSDIFQFVQDQPNPQIFFKSAFEFDFTNIVSILSFDSRSISYLLDQNNEEYFRESDFPLFYRNKLQKGAGKNCKYFYRSAIDTALRSNQTQSVEQIIQYIVTYQNDFISSWLFRSNIPQLCSTGIKLHELFESSVFKFHFEFDQWPQVHPDDREIMRPFNYNIFELRKHYKDIFPEKRFDPIDLTNQSLTKEIKLIKIKYTIILLPVIGTHYLTEKCPYTGKINSEFLKDDIYTTGVLSESDQIEIFNCENMQHFIDFKWQTYGFLFHLVSTVFQLAYLTMLFIYVMHSYINYDPAAKIGTDIFLILIFVAYPLVLETMQAFKIGPINYITDADNWLDITFIYGSAAMAIVHYINGPQHIASKILIVVVLFSAFRQTLKLLRIFSALSSLVAMLTSVIWKLKTFMTFFLIILVFFAEILAVLGVGNIKRPDGYRLVFYDEEKSSRISDDAPNVDQRQINLLFGNVIHMFRISMGDFAMIDLVKYMNNREDVIIFWIIWFIMVLVLAVVFLNFVVAEASETYNIVNDSIIETIYQQKADLIRDAESIMPNSVKSLKHFPKYIVRRQIET